MIWSVSDDLSSKHIQCLGSSACMDSDFICMKDFPCNLHSNPVCQTVSSSMVWVWQLLDTLLEQSKDTQVAAKQILLVYFKLFTNSLGCHLGYDSRLLTHSTIETVVGTASSCFHSASLAKPGRATS